MYLKLQMCVIWTVYRNPLYVCTDSIPLPVLSYNTIRSHVFSGTQPSNGGCASNNGQTTISCGWGTTLLDCNSTFNGGNFSDLSILPIFTWSKANTPSQQISIVFSFRQQISLNIVRMFFWKSASDSIGTPNVILYWSDAGIPSNQISSSSNTDGCGSSGQCTMTINFGDSNLKFHYLRIFMTFHNNHEWIFLSEVQFCGE